MVVYIAWWLRAWILEPELTSSTLSVQSCYLHDPWQVT